MKELVLATRNKGKVKELAHMLEDRCIVLSLDDIGFTVDIEEPFFTFAENAHVKASTIHAFCGKSVLADDSGICVKALSDAPGVFSARYAGEKASDAANLQLLLRNMEAFPDTRDACYKAVLCYVDAVTTKYFEGICEGTLAKAPRGDKGFGYDPIFIPAGYDKTFGELDLTVKQQLSHRGKAMAAFTAFFDLL